MKWTRTNTCSAITFECIPKSWTKMNYRSRGLDWIKRTLNWASWWFGEKCLGISRWADDTRPDDDVKWLITASSEFIMSERRCVSLKFVSIRAVWSVAAWRALRVVSNKDRHHVLGCWRLVWPYDCCWVPSPYPVPLFRTTLAAASTRRSDVWSSERFRRHYRHRTSSTSWTREDLPLCPPDRARGDNDIIRQIKQDPRRARRPEAAASVEGCWVAAALSEWM